jgi:outer membrane protein assembly factor BamB
MNISKSRIFLIIIAIMLTATIVPITTVLLLVNNISEPIEPIDSQVWTFKTGEAVKSCPALGDADGDGEMEILVGSYDNKVYCLDGVTGSKEWMFTTGSAVRADPTLGDVDEDGEMEVLVCSLDNKIYCLDGVTGSEEWAFITGSTVYSSPALGDVDADGEMEILVGSDANNAYF